MASKVFTEQEAIEIWIMKWQGRHVRHIGADYDVDPRRLYEIWTEEDFFGIREQAWEQFQKKFPDKAMFIDPSPHKKTRQVIPKAQMELFP